MNADSDSYMDLMGQRGLEVVDYSFDDNGLGISSTSPFGKGGIFIEPRRVKDPWVRPVGSRVSHYRVIYSGDGDWLRLARSSALDGILWAMRPDAAAILVNAPGAFGAVGDTSSAVHVRIDPGDLEDPFLERIHEVEVYVGEWSFPVMYLTPPFGIQDLERRVAQVLAYAPLDGMPSSHRCPECGTETSLAMLDRVRALQTLKTNLCPECLLLSLECGGPALPIEPKGWRR